MVYSYLLQLELYNSTGRPKASCKHKYLQTTHLSPHVLILSTIQTDTAPLMLLNNTTLLPLRNKPKYDINQSTNISYEYATIIISYNAVLDALDLLKVKPHHIQKHSLSATTPPPTPGHGR